MSMFNCFTFILTFETLLAQSSCFPLHTYCQNIGKVLDYSWCYFLAELFLCYSRSRIIHLVMNFMSHFVSFWWLISETVHALQIQKCCSGIGTVFLPSVAYYSCFFLTYFSFSFLFFCVFLRNKLVYYLSSLNLKLPVYVLRGGVLVVGHKLYWLAFKWINI